MSYNVIATHGFKREFKKLLKKYPSLEKEYFNLVDELEEHPTKGIDLGKDCYKIRYEVCILVIHRSCRPVRMAARKS